MDVFFVRLTVFKGGFGGFKRWLFRLTVDFPGQTETVAETVDSEQVRLQWL